MAAYQKPKHTTDKLIEIVSLTIKQRTPELIANIRSCQDLERRMKKHNEINAIKN